MANVLLCDNGGVSGVTGIKLTSDTSGALDIKVGNGSVTGLSISAAGNVGVGVTPSAWSGSKAIDVGTNTAFADISNNSVIYSNAYYNGSNTVYKQSSIPAGYYNQVSGTHIWATAGSGTAGNAITFTTRMTLDNSGNLGLGVTPSAWSSGYLAVQIANASSIMGGTSGNDTYYLTNAYFDGAWKYAVSSKEATRYQQVLGVHTWYTAASGTAGNAITWLTGLTLNANRQAGFTADVADYHITVVNAQASGYGIYTQVASNNNTQTFYDAYSVGAGNYRFRVYSNGGIANYQANNVNLSDRREKTDFQPARNYLDVLCAIPVQTFKHINQTDEGRTLGVTAQDVQAVAPELVTESNWGKEDAPQMRLSIYQTDLQYAMLKAIQELAAEVALLKGNQ